MEIFDCFYNQVHTFAPEFFSRNLMDWKININAINKIKCVHVTTTTVWSDFDIVENDEPAKFNIKADETQKETFSIS